MKKLIYFSTLFLGIVAMTSCVNDKDYPENPLSGKDQAKFQATIGQMGTRASGTSWGTGDAIGVYALNAGQQLPSGIYDGKENVKYTTPGDGVFTAASTGITFPDPGALDFVAYYPYQTTITGYTYNINVANQATPAAIDLLYSDNAKGASKAAPTVSLQFKHKLAQLVLKVSAVDGTTEMTGLTASVAGLKVDGTFDLKDGSVTTGTTVSSFTPVMSISGTAAQATAIVVPGQDIGSATVTFQLGGKTYEWSPSAKNLESGKKYTYTLKLSTSGDVSEVMPGSGIEDWEEGNPGGGTEVLPPSSGAQFYVDNMNPSIAATGALTATVNLTAETTQAWTAVSSQSWLTLSDASGTGGKAIVLTAEANTGAARTATVTITPTGGTLSPVVINVSQAAGAVTPPQDLVFAGSNFEDWSAFLGGLNSYGLMAGYTSQSDNGRGGSKALYLNGTPAGNDYVFTALVPAGGISLTGKTKLVFYIKGTAPKSLSINLYKANGTNYNVFNLLAYSAEKTLTKAADNGATGNGTNSYTGVINTGGDWMKVTLDISTILSDISVTAGQNMFALKVGKDVAYDLLVDDIQFE